jgi:hypothetical protein
MTRPFAVIVLSIAVNAHAQDSDPWKPFTSSTAGFVVILPGTPTEQKQTVKTAAGTVEVHVFAVDTEKDQTSYVVSYSALPDSAVKPGSEAKRLDNARDGAVASTKGKLVSERRIVLQNHYPGRELDIDVGGKRRVRTRIYAVGNHLYQLLIVGPTSVTNSKEASRFLNSFQLTK